jgi:serine/threonine protein kinase/Tol biopolymer transport system component
MGEVYRATDTRLKRPVAIKVLPASVAQEAERLARFQREAEVLAQLNHPHIAQIYGVEVGPAALDAARVGEAGDDVHALVMELVEGPTLADRIAQGAIPVDEALAIARQIVEALEAAHEQGIIHRDLKPANIKVRPDGTVKVLDFGLAKAMEPVGAAAGANVSQLPTITTPAMTQAGVILGTAAYMSPEQARGKPVDKRTDIWAFGCVLYEMLTGTRAFDGEDIADTLGNVLKRDPDWAAVPTTVPPFVVAAVRTCLEKSPRDRMGDMQSVRLALSGAFHTAPGGESEGAAVRSGSGRLPWTVAVVASFVAVGLVVPTVRHLSELPSAGPSQLRVDLVPPAMPSPESFALSPDGNQIAWFAHVDGRTALQVRSLADGAIRQFAAPDGARNPFWAPNGGSIGFLSQGTLKRLELSDGSVGDLSVGAGEGRGGSWSPTGSIVFARNNIGPILQALPVGTVDAAAVTTVDSGQAGHVYPWALPDGRHVLYLARGGTAETGGLFVAALDGGAPKRLSEADPFPVAFVAGHLLFTRQGRLIAQPFDLTTLTLTGDPFPVDNQTRTAVDGGSAGFAVSASVSGSLAFRPIRLAIQQLVWFDRAGRELARVADSGDLAGPSLSPDGRRLLIRRTVDGSQDIWVVDLAQGTWNPTSTGGGQPQWSPDGQRIAFFRARQNRSAFVITRVGGDPNEEDVALDSPQVKSLHDWSPDGRFLVCQGGRSDGRDVDVWAVPLTGARDPMAITRSRFNERLPAFSPDGRWLAYESDESGQFEIYVQPFLRPGERTRVSTTGGAQAAWRRDGRELYFVGLDGRLMAVPVRASADSFEVGETMPLFAVRIPNGAVQPGGLGRQYEVSVDGQRFLVVTLVDDAAPSSITLIQHWRPPAAR